MASSHPSSSSHAAAEGGGNSAVVDDMVITDERRAWAAVAATLTKPHLQRSETELSRCMTLLRNLRCIAALEGSDAPPSSSNASAEVGGIVGIGGGGGVGPTPSSGNINSGNNNNAAAAAAAAVINAMPRFTARLQLVKSARYIAVAPGVVLLSKGGREGDAETIIPFAEGIPQQQQQQRGGGASPKAPSSFTTSSHFSGTPQPPPAMGGIPSSPRGGLGPVVPSSPRLSLPNIHSGRGGATAAAASSALPSDALQLSRTGGAVALASSVSVAGATDLAGDHLYHSTAAAGTGGAGADGNGSSSRPTPRPPRGPADMFYILIRGEVVLERPTVNGRVRTAVAVGDAIGSALVVDALPPGSFYLSVAESHLLAFPWHVYEQFLPLFDEAEIARRTRYFREGVVVPVLSPFAEARFRWLARCCYPIHLQAKEIAVREGDFSDCVYFIVSGKMKVIREIDFSPALGGGGGDDLFGTANGGCGGGGGGGGSYASSNLRLLDLATLEPGEFFGELGLLRHSVDDRPAISIRDTLTITAADIATVDAERELTRIDASIPPSLRQATVYAATPATLLVLPRCRFIEVVQRGALVRFREYAKGYPSAAAIRAHFMREHRWDAFKTKVYKDDCGR